MTDEQHMYWATAAILIVFFICVGKICGVSSSIVTERERTGYTPSMTGFFKLCEAWDVEPETFGFASNQAALIASWRRNRRARK